MDSGGGGGGGGSGGRMREYDVQRGWVLGWKAWGWGGWILGEGGGGYD